MDNDHAEVNRKAGLVESSPSRIRLHGGASGGEGNTNADCLSRYPLPSSAKAPVLDWGKGEILAPATFLAFMASVAKGALGAEEDNDIWNDMDVLHFLKSHRYPSGMAARARDRVYHRAKAYR